LIANTCPYNIILVAHFFFLFLSTFIKKGSGGGSGGTSSSSEEIMVGFELVWPRIRERMLLKAPSTASDICQKQHQIS